MKIDTQDLVYVVPLFERMQFDRVRNAVSGIDQALARGQKEVIYSFDRFGLEVFQRLYSHGFCQLLPEILPENSWASTLHQALDNNPDFLFLANLVRDDAYLSGRSTYEFIDHLIATLPKPEKPLINPDAIRQQVVEILSEAQELEEAGDKAGADQLRKEAQPLIEQGQQAVAEHQEFAQAISEQPNSPADHAQKAEAQAEGDSGQGQAGDSDGQVTDAVAQALGKAIKSAQQEAQNASDEQSGFCPGLDSGTAQSTLTMDDKVELAKKLDRNKQLKEIARLAGRMKRTAAKKRRSHCQEAINSIVGVESGRNLRRLLPSEYLKLKVPVLRPLFVKGYQAASLLQFKPGGKIEAERGPIVVCMDVSGSMEGQDDTWAKAVGLAMLGIAQHEKRWARLIYFDYRVSRIDDFDPKKQGEEGTQKQLFESMTHFSGGGTCWSSALDKAIDAIETHREFKQADIILITDGISNMKQEWLAKFKEKQAEHDFNMYGVLIGSDSRRQKMEQIVPAKNILNVTARNADEADQLLSI